MATVFDLGLLEGLTPIFVGIFVFIILYAIFNKLKIFGDSSPSSALIAAVFAILFMTVPDLRTLITFFVPWVAVVFILVVILLVAVMLLGFTQKDIVGYIGTNPGITTTLIIIIVVIFFIGLNIIYPGFLSYSSNDNGIGSSIRGVIFHPRVLGAIFILVVTSFTIRYIGFQK